MSVNLSREAYDAWVDTVRSIASGWRGPTFVPGYEQWVAMYHDAEASKRTWVCECGWKLPSVIIESPIVECDELDEDDDRKPDVSVVCPDCDTVYTV